MSTLAIACALHLGEVGARGAHKHGLRILPNPIGSITECFGRKTWLQAYSGLREYLAPKTQVTVTPTASAGRHIENLR